MPIKIGTYLDDRYRVTARIGHGGMAEVYEAHDAITKNTVAIKIIREDVMSNTINLTRFNNEITIAASLKHQNIVQIYSHGTYENKPYMVIEYVDGQVLSDVLGFRSALTLEEAISAMIQLTSALIYAHGRFVIHRDVKPQNMFMLRDGTIKLGDFGIAESSGIKMQNSNGNEIIGSVHYMAPEISKGKPASAQTDIYSAGITFFELITGHLPFTGKDAVSVAVAHIKEKLPSPKKYLPNCPKQIEDIIRKATEKDPRKRYKTANEFYQDLVKIKEHPELLKEKKGFFARLFGFK